MTELVNNTDNILSNFPLCFRKNIEELCLRSTIGLLSVNLEDIAINPIRYTVDKDELNNFHFILKVPYAGKRLKWEIIFDPEDLYFAPDFDFNDEEFLSYPDINELEDHLPSWKNWNLDNPKALSQLLNEFLALYKKHQIQKLHLENIYSRYSEEYKALMNYGITPDYVEVSVDGNTIHFLIQLKVDCSSLPEYVQPILYKGNNLSEHTLYNQGDDFVHLKVSILKLDGSRSNYSIQLSPRLEQVLGNFRFPTDFKRDTSLLEIVSSIRRTLENRLQQTADHYKLKKIYIMHLAAVCFRTIVEYDVLTFNKAAFMFNIDEYNCLITITIGAKFPMERPTVMLSSIYCPESKGCNHIVDKYPYNPSLKPELNIKHLLEYLHTAVEDFKDHKH